MVSVYHRTRWGLLKISAQNGKVASLTVVSKKSADSGKMAPVLERAAREIDEYFKGRRQRFSFPLELSGTPFQKKVWKKLLTIPYGKTVSYQSIAKSIGKPKAVRAAASAVGDNPVCLIVPCHRVIAKDGSLGGYAYSLPKKSALLRLEKHEEKNR